MSSPFRNVMKWARKAINNSTVVYDPIAQGGGTGWVPEESTTNLLGEALSSDGSFEAMEMPTARQVAPPPKVVLGEYNYHSTIAQNIVHLYESALGLVVVKEAPLREANKHERLAGGHRTDTHPNIVRYVATATLQGEVMPGADRPDKVLLLMEFANSGSWQQLATFARDHGHVLPVAFCYHVLRSVLDGLIHMQSAHGMMHTDAHLGNVTFDIQDGMLRCLLIDFEASLVLLQPETWETELSPSFSLTAREITNNRGAFPEAFMDEMYFVTTRVKAGLSSLDMLRKLRNYSLKQAGGLELVVESLPPWLVAYFDGVKR